MFKEIPAAGDLDFLEVKVKQKKIKADVKKLIEGVRPSIRIEIDRLNGLSGVRNERRVASSH